MRLRRGRRSSSWCGPSRAGPSGGELAFAEQQEEGRHLRREDRAGGAPARPGWLAAELAAKVRALAPHVGVYLETEGGERLGVKRAVLVVLSVPLERKGQPQAEEGPGAGGLAVEDGELLLGTGDGTLRLDEVQPPGGRAMAAADYLRGHEPPGLALVESPS